MPNCRVPGAYFDPSIIRVIRKTKPWGQRPHNVSVRNLVRSIRLVAVNLDASETRVFKD